MPTIERLFTASMLYLAFGAIQATAATVTYTFEGTIQNSVTVGDVTNIPNFAAGVTPGVTQVMGTLQYDTNQPGIKSGPDKSGSTTGIYTLALFSLSLPTTTISFQNLANGIRVRDGTDSKIGDAIQFTGEAPEGDLQWLFNVNFAQATEQVFNSHSLPTSLNLSDFLNTSFSIWFFDPTARLPQPTRQILGTIISLEVTATSEVPLPAALPLFATILAGGGLIAWRKRRQARRAQ